MHFFPPNVNDSHTIWDPVQLCNRDAGFIYLKWQVSNMDYPCFSFVKINVEQSE